MAEFTSVYSELPKGESCEALFRGPFRNCSPRCAKELAHLSQQRRALSLDLRRVNGTLIFRRSRDLFKAHVFIEMRLTKGGKL